MKEKPKWGRIEYFNSETGGKAMIERDYKKIYICFSDPKGGYIVETEIKRPGYDGVTPVLLILSVLIGLATIVLRLLPT